MARSRYIYLVEDVSLGESEPVAAFTVKHELVAWLGRSERRPKLDGYRVTSLSDGGYGREPVELSIPELLASST